MTEFYDVKDEEERVILVSVCTGDEKETQECLDELEELAKTAGAITVAKIYQNRESVHPGTYIGKGKIEELKGMIYEYEATGIVCDDELSPAQLKNLEEELETKVIDRTVMILDIFAQRASTREGKIQVEMAQLKYRSSRLAGLGHSLSRLGGGIGTRGPGEKKLEVDRRLIRDRIAKLNKELDQVKKNRDTLRKQRTKNPIPIVSIVGYTNAGKSTLLNTLTDASVLEEDKLFATLDPATRNLELESGQQILLTDTVGFIRKLPHHLINAFRSTLEEAKYADIILHVADASNRAVVRQMETVYETLDNLGVKDKMFVTAFNKQDKLEEEVTLKDVRADYTVKISAKQGDGLGELLEIIEKILKESKVYIEKVFSYNDAGEIQRIRKYGQLLEEKYLENGIFVRAYVPHEIYDPEKMK
ncbi:GTPase HflX [[Clostridium] polysaccharolyticum]|uniref:GTPase HflX n=1 Tax=[Clostridium] polysaccharolyticum TaxID=29364 RepID=A0A1H9YVR9_9FIRM|nr:GTPase HflX [[Clostridium] polysaccharolyticum]SES72660.1 GTP-binding protein HflX [[Clostridium] polysaccharolyticum]